MKKIKKRKAFLCCSKQKEKSCFDLWEERMGNYIPLVNKIEEATEIYVVEKDNIEHSELIKVLEQAQKLKLKVYFLDNELIHEELAKQSLNSKQKQEGMEIDK